jgi:hypothetical protein
MRVRKFIIILLSLVAIGHSIGLNELYQQTMKEEQRSAKIGPIRFEKVRTLSADDVPKMVAIPAPQVPMSLISPFELQQQVSINKSEINVEGIKNDLALQKLILESLLAQSKSHTSKLDLIVKLIGLFGAVVGIFVGIKTLLGRRKEV